jgi:hypothetical protein
MQVDLSPPLSIQADDGFLGRQIQALLGPMWTRLSSSLASTYCLSFLRHMRGRMREFASQHGVDPISLASQPPELDTEYDRLYRKHVAVITSMVSVMISSMPPEIAEKMISGDPSGLFQHSARYFDDPGYAHVLVCAYISAQGLEIENWMPDAPAQPGVAFFSSQPFLGILESGILAARMMEGHLAEDPFLRWHRSWAFVPGARIGGLHIAAVQMCKNAGDGWSAIDDARRDAKVTGQWLDAMGRYYKPLGYQMALNYRKLLKDAGLGPGVGPESEEQDQVPLPTEMPASFTDTVLAIEVWARKWRTK